MIETLPAAVERIAVIMKQAEAALARLNALPSAQPETRR